MPRGARWAALLLLVALFAAQPTAAKPSTAASAGLTILGFIGHFFSLRPVGHGQAGQVEGYDWNYDGQINRYEEWARVDSRGRVWQAGRFLRALDKHTSNDGFITKSAMRQYLRSFDLNANGRIDVAGGEFGRLYRTIWHKGPPRTARYTAFERRSHG